MRRGGRQGLPSRSGPLLVWVVGIAVALLVVWLVFRLLNPQELQHIGPVGLAFASWYAPRQVWPFRQGPPPGRTRPHCWESPVNRGEVASQEERTA